MKKIKIEKTVYDKQSPDDGKRILVMRMWPRGVSKDSIDQWEKNLGTEKELIKKWKEKSISWKEFKESYLKSLKGKEDLLQELAQEAKKGTITLLCSCKDAEHCHRTLLKSALEKLH